MSPHSPIDLEDRDAMPRDPEAPDFDRGDQVELGARMIVLLRNERRTIITGDETALYAYDPARGLHFVVAREEQSRIVQGFAGASVQIEKKKPLRLKASDVHGAMSLAYDQMAKPGFFSEAPAGLAFANGLATVSEAGVNLAPHSPDHRARFG
jgi:hypothetical protein